MFMVDGGGCYGVSLCSWWMVMVVRVRRCVHGGW